MTEVLLVLAGAAFGALIGWLASRASGSASLARLKAELAAAERRVSDQQRAHDAYAAQVRGDHDTLRQEFQALSAQSLQASQEALLRVAQERLSRDRAVADAELARREQAVRQLVEPMAKALDDVRRQTSEADLARAEAQAQLAQQVRHMLDASAQLGRQTESLRSALRRPEVRGRWGELHLRRVVEVAGLVNGVDFDEQESGTAPDGSRLRPDMIVTLAGGRRIVVDAKTPLDALLDVDGDPERAEEHAARHVRNVRLRVKELSSKAYREQFGSEIDFSVLFLPAESFLQVATERDPQLLTDAYEAGVIIATPTVLVAMLRTVAHTWKAEALAKNAKEVLQTGQELYKRLSTMGEHLARVGKAIDQAGDAYNKTIGSLERQVLPQARRFAALQQIDADLETREVETAVRAINAPELLDPTFDAQNAH
ncbi:DNA recombination protein RmuC [Demequina capsici]|uniref:DNA recombination protein RmuC n=1 Tax=Demequina capsici TaxID=3075620 RepID=A0AA96JB34_9MICO|nr:DNA recombination protein RmuC [Demequina sp. PMTSA13]WNM27990.1 DNA recombination protein RmuC [Demequina sp. PMTSA13]